MNIIYLFFCISFMFLGICLGLLMQEYKVQFWRLKWIELEHELAKLQGRDPRNISKIK